MKNVKRLSTWILIMVLVLSVVGFASCIEKPQPQQLDKLALPDMAENQMTVIIKYGENDYVNYVVTLAENHCSATTVEGVLQYLADQEVLQIVWHDTSYGKTIDQLGEIAVSDATRTYFAFYTSLEANGASAGGEVYVVDGVGLCYSNYGISQAQVAGKSVAYFEVVTW